MQQNATPLESRSLFYLIERLLDILLTVLDNDTLVVLVNFNTEEGVNYFQMYLKNTL